MPKTHTCTWLRITLFNVYIHQILSVFAVCLFIHSFIYLFLTENRISRFRLSAAQVSPAQSSADSTVSGSVTMTTPGLTTVSANTSMSNPVTMTTSGHHNSTTEPITSNVTSVFPNMTTQQTNSSSESPSPATTSSSHNTSESTNTSSIPHTIPHTTSRVPKPAKKSKFEAWSFLGGAAVGLCVTLACVGLVYCIIDRKKYPHDSVQYRAM